MSDALAQLRLVTNAVAPLDDATFHEFSTLFKPIEAKRKEVLTMAGTTEQYLYFVLDGVQRVFFSDEKGHEATIVFTYAPSFGGVLDSLMLQQPSRYFYETLTSSRLLRARFTDLALLRDNHEPVKNLLHRGVTLAFSGVMERLAELQSYSSTEKFTTLLKRSPHILQLVPHKYLANYLGIDSTNFSKLINQVRI